MEQEARFPIFKERLNSLLEARSITEFAKELGMSRQTIGFYLNGERIPDIKALRQICEYCGVSADWLIGLTDIRSADPKIKMICEYTGLSENTVNKLHKTTMFKYRNLPDDIPEKIADELKAMRLFYEHAERQLVDMRQDYYRLCSFAISLSAEVKNKRKNGEE